jgi:hypothetical protein
MIDNIIDPEIEGTGEKTRPEGIRTTITESELIRIEEVARMGLSIERQSR